MFHAWDGIIWGMENWIYLVLFAVVCAFIGRWVAYQCGRRQKEGFWLGLLLGPFGVLIELLLPKFPKPSDAERQRLEWP